MSRLTWALVIAPLCLLLFTSSPALGQITAFQANFSLDTVDQEPSLAPPGEPDEDEIILNTSGGIITVVQNFGVMTDKPVLLDNRSSGSLSLQAVLDPDLRNYGQYVVRWTSMLSGSTDIVTVGVYSETGIMGAMNYKAAGELVYNNISLETGYTPNVPQNFELTVDIVNSKTSLSIDGYADPNSQDKSFPLLNSTGTFKRILISHGGLGYEEFALDDIEVIATDANVSTKRTSWSSLKAMYD